MRTYQALFLIVGMIFLSCFVSTCRTVSVVEKRQLPLTSTISAVKTLLTSQLTTDNDSESEEVRSVKPLTQGRSEKTVTLKKGEAEMLVGLLDDLERSVSERTETTVKNLSGPFPRIAKIVLITMGVVSIFLCALSLLKRTGLFKHFKGESHVSTISRK